MLTLKDAKKIYLKYDCSLFALAREEPDLYNEYKRLNVSGIIEEKWKQELFIVLTDMLKRNGSVNLFNRIYDLSENGNRCDKERLLALKELLAFIKYDNLKINASVSEAIIGRKAVAERSGMIFWAYDLGDRKTAKELVLYTMNLLSYQPMEDGLKRRFEQNRAKCCLINSELQLGCFD